jgi:hypothetical protein
MLLELLSDARHQWIIVGLVNLQSKVLHDFFISLDLSLAQGVTEELTRFTLLLTLLL